MAGARDDRRISMRGARFLAVGAGNTLVTYALYCVLVSFIPPQVAYAIVFGVGIVIAYIANSHFVFKSRMRPATAAIYPLIYLVQYAANALLIEVFTAKGLGPRAALAVALVLVTPLSFILNRLVLGGRTRSDRRR